VEEHLELGYGKSGERVDYFKGSRGLELQWKKVVGCGLVDVV